MQLLSIVRAIEGTDKQKRLQTIISYLKDWNVDYTLHRYESGINLVIPSYGRRWIGVSCHYDVVEDSPGANDNASAIAVCLEILRRCLDHEFGHIGVQFFFFDEEEDNLRGSRAWVKEEPLFGILGLLNFEMVGMGDQMACWPCSADSNSSLLQSFEEVCLEANVSSHRFDMLILNAGDHQPFIEAGIENTFCITSVSQQGLEVAKHYYKAMEFEVDSDTLWEIFQKAPLFEHYHKPTDRSHHLNEESLQRVAEMSWRTLLQMDEKSLKLEASSRGF